MRSKIIFIVFAIVTVVFTFKFCTFKNQDTSSLESNTNLIQQQILNVGKLVVTEGHFSEVLTYKDQDKYFGGMFSFDKKALLVINAEVTVSFNLREVKYDINEKEKTVTITNIPKEEIKIFPDIKFYDVTQSKLNPFNGDDYNKISTRAKASIARKIDKSSLKSNAQNRLISELSKMLILTNSLGWTLVYKGNTIVREADFNLKN